LSATCPAADCTIHDVRGINTIDRVGDLGQGSSLRDLVKEDAASVSGTAKAEDRLDVDLIDGVVRTKSDVFILVAGGVVPLNATDPSIINCLATLSL
jgi:hypothetical protein